MRLWGDSSISLGEVSFLSSTSVVLPLRGFLRLVGEFVCLQTKRSERFDDCLWIADRSELTAVPLEEDQVLILQNSSGVIALSFDQSCNAKKFLNHMDMEKHFHEEGESPKEGCVESGVIKSHLDRSDSTIVKTYFQYYGRMSNQMNMLQDTIRTETYRKAILSNSKDFNNQRIMDVGAGSGVLSFFASKAGAREVVCVEASSTAEVLSELVAINSRPCGAEEASNAEQKNGTPDPPLLAKFEVIQKRIEDLDLSKDLQHEKVDVLISEPLGTFLFNERMIETYLYARDAFLKPGGKMFPNKCQLFFAPFSDPTLYNEIVTRCAFWATTDFYGIDLSSTVDRAIEELLRQPIIDYVDPKSIVSVNCFSQEFDFQKLEKDSLEKMEFFFRFEVASACVVHGLAGWFDVHFEGSEETVSFSTSPWAPPTHWYQIRFLLKTPIAANPGQDLVGKLTMIGNNQQSYSIKIRIELEGTNISSESATIDLKDPDYRYYTNPQSAYIPTVCPAQVAAQTTQAAQAAQTSAGPR